MPRTSWIRFYRAFERWYAEMDLFNATLKYTLQTLLVTLFLNIEDNIAMIEFFFFAPFFVVLWGV